MFKNLVTYKYKKGRPIYESSDVCVESTKLYFHKQYLFVIYENIIFYLLSNNNVRRIFSE
jgi:hypothetical protein